MTKAKLPTNPFKYGEPFYSVYDGLLKLEETMHARELKATQLAGLADGAKFINLPKIELSLTPPSTFRKPNQYSAYLLIRPLEEVEKNVADTITTAKALIEEHREEYEKAAVHNDTLRKQVIALMDQIGVKESYTTYEFPTSRSKTRKAMNHRAGFLNDLDRIAPKNPLKAAEYAVAEYERSFKSWLDAERRSENEKKRSSVQRMLAKYITPELSAFYLVLGLDVVSIINNSTENNVEYNLLNAINEIMNKGGDVYYELAQKIHHLRHDPFNTKIFAELRDIFNSWHLERELGSADTRLRDEIFDAILEFENTQDAEVFKFLHEKLTNLSTHKAKYEASCSLKNLINLI